ncbi:AAA family ATPase [Candidatus Bipolaricaulota bacterium]|nr:AAA family ATPase [Candidatus Bipolaricaulota bacterium]
MYKSFEVRNFRCFRELTIDNLDRVNLIAGMNNVGKTALLEALFLHCGAYNPELALRINGFRGIEEFRIELTPWAETPWDSLFFDFDVSKEVKLVSNSRASNQRILQLRTIRQLEELAKISRSIRHIPSNKAETTPLSSGSAQVLELKYKEAGREGKYFLIFDPKGPRTEPIPPPPPFPAIFLAARVRVPLATDAQRFGKLEIERRHSVVLDALQVIEPRLRDLAVVVTSSGPMIHGDIGLGKLIPLPFLGDGMNRLASLVLAIGNAPNGIVLVDEIENGLHYSVLPKVWKVIGEVARKFNVQIFATTHSLECVTAAHEAFSDSKRYDFRLHRLERVDETIHVVTYDQETLEAAIETGLEVR